MTDSASQRVSRVFDPVRKLFDRYDHAEKKQIAPTKKQRWMKHSVHYPEDHNREHEASWTAAPGVWYCQDCHEWFRTWEETPTRPERQKSGF